MLSRNGVIQQVRNRRKSTGGPGNAPLGTEKNSEEFFAASPSGEPTVPVGKGWLEKNPSVFFDFKREGVTLIIL
jgi:hypothetical protein